MPTFYHGGNQTPPGTPLWFARDVEYAKGYARKSNGGVFAVDLTDDELLEAHYGKPVAQVRADFERFGLDPAFELASITGLELPPRLADRRRLIIPNIKEADAADHLSAAAERASAIRPNDVLDAAFEAADDTPAPQPAGDLRQNELLDAAFGGGESAPAAVPSAGGAASTPSGSPTTTSGTATVSSRGASSPTTPPTLPQPHRSRPAHPMAEPAVYGFREPPALEPGGSPPAPAPSASRTRTAGETTPDPVRPVSSSPHPMAGPEVYGVRDEPAGPHESPIPLAPDPKPDPDTFGFADERRKGQRSGTANGGGVSQATGNDAVLRNIDQQVTQANQALQQLVSRATRGQTGADESGRRSSPTPPGRGEGEEPPSDYDRDRAKHDQEVKRRRDQSAREAGYDQLANSVAPAGGSARNLFGFGRQVVRSYRQIRNAVRPRLTPPDRKNYDAEGNRRGENRGRATTPRGGKTPPSGRDYRPGMKPPTSSGGPGGGGLGGGGMGGGGGGGAAAGSAGGAAGGEAAGGTAGGAAAEAIPEVAIVVAVTTALTNLAKSAYDLAYQQEDYARKLAEFSPSQAANVGVLDANRAVRAFETGEDTAGSSKELTEAIDRFEKAIQPIEKVATSIANTVGAEVMDLLTTLVKLGDPLVKAIEFLAEKFTPYRRSKDDPDYSFGGWLDQVARDEAAKAEAIRRRIEAVRRNFG